ncbi:MAG: hypothetical protein KUG78_15020 [Kangiellaceae bacterium]|nr:hypothetical protein [Kangiellaceae bacterium]
MSKSEEFVEQRIMWAAGRHNLPTSNSFPIQDIDETACAGFELTKLKCLGKPIYLFFEDENNWSVLGTRGITGLNDSTYSSVRYDEIKDLEGFDELKVGGKRKEDLKELKVLTSQKETVFKSKSGGDFFALWNICLMLQRIS